MTHINLFSFATRRKQAIVSGLRLWSQVLAILLIFLTTATWATRSHTQHLERQQDQLQRKYEQERRVYQEAVLLKAQIEALRTREAITLELASDKSMLTILGIVSGAQTKGKGRLYVESLSIAPRVEGSTQEQRDDFVLAINGVGLDNLAIAQFAAALRDHSLFEQVELKSAGSVELGDRIVRSYRLECTF